MKKFLLKALFIILVSSMLFSCAKTPASTIEHQAAPEPQKEMVMDDIVVEVISMPPKSNADENLTITWQIIGMKGSNITHTAIHYDNAPHEANFKLYKKASTYLTGVSPQVFTASFKATKEKYMYVRVHAIVNGKDYYDQERRILIEVPVSTQLPAPLPSTPPAPVQNQSASVQQQTQQTQTSAKEFSVEADDNGFYPASITVNKGDHIKLTLKVREQGVYFSGLKFTATSVNYNSGDVKPGAQTLYEFDATDSFKISSWWPSSSRFKADFSVNVK